MATITKNFKIKQGLIVEGSEATVAGNDILTKKQADQDYIVSLIGGTSTDQNTPSTIVKRDASGNFSAGTVTANLTGNVNGDLTGNVTGDLTGNADTATALQTARTIELTGDITGSVSFDGTQNVQISTSLGADFATDAEIATAKSEAIADAATYTNNRETAITSAYQSYADTAESDAISAAASDATTKANNALASANSYTDDEVSAINLSLTAYADQSQADAESFATAADTTLYGTVTTDIATAKSEAISAAQGYADTAVANLVDGAPGLLDTLNELAAAIGDDENFVTTVTSSLSLKADTTYVNSEISDLDTAAQGYANTAESNAASYTNSQITQEVADRNGAISSAITTEIADRNTAINAAIAAEVSDRNSAITTAVDAITTSDIEEGTNKYFTDQRAIDAVGGTIGDAIDALTTSDIEEGSNKYFTDQRAQDAVAGDITNAISGVNSTIDALDTDDISEGSNLYFTNQRAIDAVGGNINDAIAAGSANASPTYQEINFTWATKQVGTYTFIANSGVSTVYTWNGNSFPAAKFLVRVREGQHSQVSEVLVTKDDTGNVAITEYAIVHTNGILGDVTAEFANGSYSLKVNAQNNSTEVIVSGMLLAYGD